jgi:hypothetical protein
MLCFHPLTIVSLAGSACRSQQQIRNIMAHNPGIAQQLTNLLMSYGMHTASASNSFSSTMVSFRVPAGSTCQSHHQICCPSCYVINICYLVASPCYLTMVFPSLPPLYPAGSICRSHHQSCRPSCSVTSSCWMPAYQSCAASAGQSWMKTHHVDSATQVALQATPRHVL